MSDSQSTTYPERVEVVYTPQRARIDPRLVVLLQTIRRACLMIAKGIEDYLSD